MTHVIKATIGEFIGWVNSYGEAKNPGWYLPGELAYIEQGGRRKAIYHRAGAGGQSYGGILFWVEALDVERLQIEVELDNGLNPSSAELIAYRNEMLAALLKRWPQPHKPGRPRLHCHEWAWEQVNALGKEPREIRGEWERRYDAETGGGFEDLQDPDRNFRYAIDPRRKKSGRN